MRKLRWQCTGSKIQSNSWASIKHNFLVVTWLFFILIDVLPLGCTTLHKKNDSALFPLVWKTRQWHCTEQSPVWKLYSEQTHFQKPYSDDKATKIKMFIKVWLWIRYADFFLFLLWFWHCQWWKLLTSVDTVFQILS